MKPLARTRIVMWEGASLWVSDAVPPQGGKAPRVGFHSHHAIQATFSLGGSFRLETEHAQVSGDAVAVAADVPHAFEAEGLIAMVFIDPESRTGRAAERRLFGGRALAEIPDEIVGDLRARIAANFRAQKRDDAALASIGRELAGALGEGAVAIEPDLRIRKVIDWAAQEIEGPISLSDALAIVDLSASRLRHLFVEQTGLPFKTYLLWLRLMRAVEGFAAGATLTEAAHHAGFADSAHLSRTFRRMFGIPPTALSLV